MFIHWGPYSVAARGEWVMNRERIPVQEYMDTYAQAFKAERFDPDAWVALARSAGMKYMVLTTRHHDGFCLWDTGTTPYNAGRMGPRRDLVRAFAEAVRRGGLKLGFYYSVADWSHPDYPGGCFRDWSHRWDDEGKRQRFVAYYHAQLEELMTRYGPVDVLWYDGCMPQPLDGAGINRRVYAWQPEILINERNGDPCDFRCSEQSLKAKDGAWESCITLNNNWGYHAGDPDWKNARDVIRSLLQVAGKGGNLLLNVGPRGDGTIPEDSVRILQQVGDWLARHREFLPNSGRSPFTWNNTCIPTVRENLVYLHLVNLSAPTFCYAEVRNRVRSAYRLVDRRPVRFEQKGPRLFLYDLPLPSAEDLVPTVVLDVEGTPEALTQQTTFWIPD
jgi:alpha-L-fucosidase